MQTFVAWSVILQFSLLFYTELDRYTLLYLHDVYVNGLLWFQFAEFPGGACLSFKGFILILFHERKCNVPFVVIYSLANHMSISVSWQMLFNDRSI